MAVHPQNRGGAMVTAWDMHTKGNSIMDTGVKQPEGGLAAQLCPVKGDPLREGPMAANKNMINRSN